MKLSQNFEDSDAVSPLSLPLPGQYPLGENPRVSAGDTTIYRQLRDARSQARTAERRRQHSADPAQRVGLCPEWTEVRALARELLSTHAKDIEALVWLTEAETRLSGFAGLKSSLELMLSLIADHGTALHSIDEEAPAERFSPIAGLSGIGGEGTLIQPIRLLGLPPQAPFGEQSLWTLQSGVGGDETAAAIRAAEPDGIRLRLGEIDGCLGAIEGLDRVLTAMFGAGAPPLARLREVLEEAAAAVRLAADLTDVAPSALSEDAREAPTPALGNAPEGGHPAAEARADPTAPQPITTRDQAFRQMLTIAAFFRRTEPHSPIAAALETLVRRGQMDFTALLAELVPDEGTRLAVMTKAGIAPAEEAK